MRVILIVLALSVTACGSDTEATPPGRGRGPYSGASEAPPPPAPLGPVATGARRTSRERDRYDYGSLATPPPSTPTGSTTTDLGAPSEAAEPTERDLGAELATAIGSPASCIDLDTARGLHGHLRIRVTATVMPTGTITRASASGSGLSEAALSCIEARAVAAHLAAPIERAPRGVNAALDYDVTTTDDQVSVTTPDFVRPEGSVAPGIVTPAVGPSGRVEGSVAPDIVLPAQVP